jgi:hypothetical protein
MHIPTFRSEYCKTHKSLQLKGVGHEIFNFRVLNFFDLMTLVHTGWQLKGANISENIRKDSKWSQWDTRGPGETDS